MKSHLLVLEEIADLFKKGPFFGTSEAYSWNRDVSKKFNELCLCEKEIPSHMRTRFTHLVRELDSHRSLMFGDAFFRTNEQHVCQNRILEILAELRALFKKATVTGEYLDENYTTMRMKILMYENMQPWIGDN